MSPAVPRSGGFRATPLRVLFVDDDVSLLAGLRNALRSQRRSWEMAFCEGAAAALGLFGASPFDVVVTDMRMPGIDGADLLGRVKAQSPDTVRIVLTGHMDPTDIERARQVAHELVAKPCHAERLIELVQRTRARILLASADLVKPHLVPR